MIETAQLARLRKLELGACLRSRGCALRFRSGWARLIDAQLAAGIGLAGDRRGEVIAGADAVLRAVDLMDARQSVEALPQIGVLDRRQTAVALPVPIVFAPL
jgi:hypothetical protein